MFRIFVASLGLITSSVTLGFSPGRYFTRCASLSSTSSSLISSSSANTSHRFRSNHKSKLFSRVRLLEVDRTVEVDEVSGFDPFECSDKWSSSQSHPYIDCNFNSESAPPPSNKVIVPFIALTSVSTFLPTESSNAATPLSTGDFNPENFKPVCAASDSFYRFLQGSTRAVVGDENFSEYGPLIAGGLLRIRLELCVVESFFNEAVGPFIKENGLSWILPLHETVETFLAGAIFALATTFILVGSTKLIQIIAFYGDLIVGGPCRLFGGFFFDRARGEPVTLDINFLFWKKRLIGPPVDFKEEEKRKKEGSDGDEKFVDFEKIKMKDYPLLVLSGGVKVVGETSRVFREFIEALDLFVGRYLVLLASGYIIVKFLHFKIFPDFP